MTAATKEEVKAAAAAKQPFYKQMSKSLGDVFVPILPAIVASGLMMGLVEALGKAIPAFAGSDWYGILDLFANTAFTFLPILIAVSSARVFGGNIFLGALLGAMFHIGATSYGVTGIPGFLITLDYTLQYAVILTVSFVIAFVLTWIFWKEDEETEKKEEIKTDKAVEGKETETKKEEQALAQTEKILYAPIKGTVIARESIPDAVFASGALGDGVGIEPECGEVLAPCDGEIVTVTETKHAVGIMGPEGMELLIHVGIDTVKMNGEGFDVTVGVGDQVKKGQKLLTFDIEKIKAAGYSATTAVLVTNSGDYPNYRVVKTGAVETGEEIISAE